MKNPCRVVGTDDDTKAEPGLEFRRPSIHSCSQSPCSCKERKEKGSKEGSWSGKVWASPAEGFLQQKLWHLHRFCPRPLRGIRLAAPHLMVPALNAGAAVMEPSSVPRHKERTSASQGLLLVGWAACSYSGNVWKQKKGSCGSASADQMQRGSMEGSALIHSCRAPALPPPQALLKSQCESRRISLQKLSH